MEGRVLIKWRSRSLAQGMRRTRDLFVKPLHQTRLTDACLADDQRYLALTIEDTFPTIHKRAQFVLAPDERSQTTGGGGRFEPPSHSARLNYAIESRRPLDSFHCLRPAIFHNE